MGASWERLGRLLGRLGGVLRVSRVRLGVSWGPFEGSKPMGYAHDGGARRDARRQGEKNPTIENPNPLV